MPLALRQGVAVLALEIRGNCLVELVFLFGGCEGTSEQAAQGVFHILQNLAAKGAVAEGGKPFAKGGEIAPGIGELGAEGREITEEAIVYQSGETVKLDQGVLERRGSEEDFSPAFRGAPYGLAKPIALPIAVPELVGLIHYDQIPWDGFYLRREPGCVVVGANDDLILLKWVGMPGFLEFPIGVGIQNRGWEIKFFLKFQRPLLSQGGRCDDEKLAMVLSPVLAKNESGFDGLSEPDLIRQENTI